MKPLVVEYLKDHTFQQLEDEHGVIARPSADNSKFSLNYDMIMVKNGDKIAEQCRGMVIRPKEHDWFDMMTSFIDRDWKNIRVGECDVLAWPMNRFYNHGDPAAADIDWNDPKLRVYEKLDGTMVVIYWDPLHGRWFAATRSIPEADLPIRAGHMEIGDMTFSGLFGVALKATREALSGQPVTWDVDGFDKVIHLNKELTYVFELTSPHNRVVVKYNEPRVTLLAVRHTESGEERPIEELRLEHVQRPKVWELRSASALDAFVNAAEPEVLEGAVVCDSKFNRLKVKNKAWILSSRAKDLVTVSRRGAVEAIIAGTIDDVIPLVEKDIADELLGMQANLKEYLQRVDDNYRTWSTEAAGSRKRFAELVNISGDWATPYFQLMDKKGDNALHWVTTAQQAGRLSPRLLDSLLEKIRIT